MSTSWDVGPLRATVADLRRLREAAGLPPSPDGGLDPRSQALAWALVTTVDSQALRERIAGARSADELLAILCLPTLLRVLRAGPQLRAQVDALCNQPVQEAAPDRIIQEILQAVREHREEG